ncbi:proteasome subunit alpha type-1-like isoform X2 [Gordionus sp. m RMFG-2023]|uniref:proteasome subunit alpha type-1-like isoform X2 n=1 Tax=Gordionus sp. m RMFG-2023 TaxID=3053472 RepID=UPI0031FBF641
MFRNHYDSDVTVLSPQGRIHQIEYAMEAVKQGSSTVGVKNKTHAVIAALMRSTSELSSHQKKIFELDDNLGVSIAGLTADGKILTKYMLNECLMFRYDHTNPMPIERLVRKACNKMQVNTQRYGRRPYGVGLLVCGYDSVGPHVFQLCPSANYYDCKSMAIGSRSQAARTYLEKYTKEINQSDYNCLIEHAIKALKETLPSEMELNDKNCQIGIVGRETSFHMFSKDDVNKHVALALKDLQESKVAAQTLKTPITVDIDMPRLGTSDEQPPDIWRNNALKFD